MADRRFHNGEPVAVRLPDGSIHWASVLIHISTHIVTDAGSFRFEKFGSRTDGPCWVIDPRDRYFIDRRAVLLPNVKPHWKGREPKENPDV